MMSADAEVKALIKTIAGPQALGAKLKTAWFEVSIRTGIPPGRVENYWHGEIRKISEEDLTSFRKAAKEAEAQRAGDELAELKGRIRDLESLLSNAHSYGGGPRAHRGRDRQAVRSSGLVDCAVD